MPQQQMRPIFRPKNAEKPKGTFAVIVRALRSRDFRTIRNMLRAAVRNESFCLLPRILLCSAALFLIWFSYFKVTRQFDQALLGQMDGKSPPAVREARQQARPLPSQKSEPAAEKFRL